MIVWTLLLVDMFCVLVLCPALLVAGVQTLTIDSQLGTSIEDCFERVTIGEQLPPSAIFRNVSELTTRECEQICKQDKQCQSYDYGVGAKGNATCNLSKFGDKELKDTKLMRHPDYDVYLRRLNCEQAPPIPLPPLPQSDESQGPSQDGPAHRPIFRPVDEEPKRPDDQHSLADDFHRPNDMRPHETIYRPLRPQFYNNYYDFPYNRPNRPYSPGYRPHYPVNNHIDERPDDYGIQKPENDQNLGYGPHKPQDLPFQPERPHRPNEQNLNNNRPKPDDPYDVLNFQDPYVRPPISDPGLWRPDPYFPPSPEDEVHDIYGPKPIRPNDYPDRPVRPVLDEKPNYHYIVRPNRKPAYQNPPRPQEDFGYAPIKPYQDYQSPDLGYGQNDPVPIGPSSPPYRPERPHDDDYHPYPSRPYEKPTYSYNSQYASNYGQSSHYNQGNDVHVEIYDPLRPYRPPKPTNKPLADKPTSGYGQNTHDFAGYNRPASQNNGYGSYDSHTSQNYHSQSQNSQSQYYGSLQNSQSSGYGQQDSHNDFSTQGGYNRPPQDPINHSPPKPTYVSQSTQYGQNSQSYGSQSQSSQYGSQNYGPTSQRPLEPYHKPPSNQGYGSQDNQGGYGSQSSYGSNNQGGYGTQTSSYNSNQASYGGTTQHSTSHLSYGSTQNAYGSSHNSGYGSQNHDSNYDRPDRPYTSEPSLPEDDGYKNAKPGSATKRPVYGSQKPESDKKRPVYDNERPQYDKNRPGYGNERPDYDKYQPVYGNERPEADKNHPGYGNEKPDYDKHRPVYGNERPEVDKNRPGYGNEEPVYDKKRPGYGNVRPEADKNRPGYGNEKPDYDKHRPVYGNKTPEADNRPGYGSEKPDYDKNRPGYGNEKPEIDNNRPEYGQNSISSTTGYDKPSRPDVRPVYEYDLDRPDGVPSYIVRPDGQVITSKPVAISDVMGRRPGASRDPGYEFSYKGQNPSSTDTSTRAGAPRLVGHIRQVVCLKACRACGGSWGNALETGRPANKEIIQCS